MPRLKYELLLLLCSLIWGSAFVAQQLGMEQGLGPMTFNALRFSLGGLCLLPLILWRKPKIRATPGSAKPFPLKVCIVSGILLFAASALQQTALKTTTPANAGFITAFYILFVPLIGLFLGHKINQSLWIGILICLIGFYFLSVTGSFVVSRGDWLTLLSAVIFAGQITAIGHIADKGDPVRMACLQFSVCATLSLLSGVLFEQATLAQVQSAAWPIAYAGLVSIGIGHTLQVICQKHCPPAPAAIIMSLEGVFAALAGYLILHQNLTARALFGCALILGGVLIAQLLPLRKKPLPGAD
jgi:drug/metabolite transporter (DMT)-like permease